MACFDDVLALKELCDETTPFSGIYLNDIGITKSFINDIITSDYQEAGEDAISTFVNSKTRHAIRVVKGAIHSKFGGLINSTSLIVDHRLGYTQNDMTAVAGGDFRGIQMTLNNYTNHVNATISSISLQVNTTGNVDILVYDLFQDKLIETIPITAVSGEIVTVYPHLIIESYGRPLNLAFVYDATGITSVQTYVRDGQCCGITSCTTSFMTAKGVTNSSGVFTNQNMTQINHTAGLSITYSLNCDMYSWMCDYAQVLALPIAYKAASEIYLHGIQTFFQRSSNNSNLNVEQMKETQGFYELQFREQLDSILHNMAVPKETACFQCKTPARTAVVLP